MLLATLMLSSLLVACANVNDPEQQTKDPAQQGLFGIFEVFIDTIVLCTMTAIVVVISYPQVSHCGNNFIMMTISAYSHVLGDFAKYFLVIAVLCFAFATVICWAHYGIECTSYLSKKRYTKNLFVFVYSLSVILGAVFKADWIWEFADLAIGAMTFTNIIVICLMSKEVKKETELYFKKG
jgi:AGCS family alanine or glycine:cation symporter